jgi:thioredoxin reductase
MKICVSSILFLLYYVTELGASSCHHQFCIIGAGPGGLQLGYFFQQAGSDYVIFEKNDTAGSFYLHYPRHRTLISVNKRFTGTSNHEFNLRHDWNSLLSHDRTLELRHYTKEYFPGADVYVQYLKDYASKLNLNIEYRTEVLKIEKGDKFELAVLRSGSDRGMCTCDAVVVSTGIWVPVVPNLLGAELMEGYESMSVDPEDFDGQTVLILGKGNAGFETAQNLVGSAAYIHMLSRSRVRQAYQTHYVGDLRAINNQLVDTYQLKSLDGFLESEVEASSAYNISLNRNKEGKIQFNLPEELLDRDNVVFPEYDRIIRCIGFKFDFSIFGETTEQLTANSGKYPGITAGFQSITTPGLYVAGAASHAVDYRRSAGGFIHGFRYNSRALHKHLEWKYNGVKWPSLTIDAVDLTDHIVKRINEASGLYQMFGVLADVALIRDDYTAVYLEDVPIGTIPYGEEYTGHEWSSFILINFEYGKDFSGPGKDTLRGKVERYSERANRSNFLHPVLYHFKNVSSMYADDISGNIFGADTVYHVLEDFLTNWHARQSHVLPMRRFVESIFQQDLRQFSSETCFKFLFHYGNYLPLSCKEHLQGGSVI